VDPYVAAAIGFVTAAALALINNWLTGRENVAEGVRNQRIATYPGVWNRTGVVSRWPRTDAGREQFLRLHEDLRRWYYAGGGLYLSTRARQRHEHLQLVLEAVVSLDDKQAAGCYQDVMKAASYFRTALTDDLETRERRSIVVALARRRADGKDRKEADARLEKVRTIARRSAASRPTDAASRRPIHAVTREDEDLKLGGPAASK
jgi:hypothetical protein